MSSEPDRDTDEVAAPQTIDDLPVFSERLSTILEDVVKGEAPNAGRFCGNCYTPIDPQRVQCAQCGQAVEKRPPVQRVPDEVLLMFRSKRRRESLVVNSFAYAGLLLAVVIFIVSFSFIFFYTTGNRFFTLMVVNIVALFVLSRVLAGLIGGFVGDEVGFRYAHRKLVEEWAVYEAERE